MIFTSTISNSILAMNGRTIKRLCHFKKCYNLRLNYDRDPGPLFLNKETQEILASLTQMRFAKIFRKREVKDNSIEIKFMTDDELNVEMQNVIHAARQNLQMPPIVKVGFSALLPLQYNCGLLKVKEDKTHVISKDALIKSFSDTAFVVCDISFGLNANARKVIIRNTDGSLEYAPMGVAKRAKQLYIPLKGCKIQSPKMFESNHVESCLKEGKYEFLLDRLQLQYEPYEKEYHNISARVYMHISENGNFEVLRSTRHFGPMVFFLAWHKNIDDLLYDMITRNFLINGVQLISLMYKMNNVNEDYGQVLKQLDDVRNVTEINYNDVKRWIFLNCSRQDLKEDISDAEVKSQQDTDMNEICLQFIQHYIKTYSVQNIKLELALQTLHDIINYNQNWNNIT